MKVSIYLTWFSKNSKKFHVDCCPSYGHSSKWPFWGQKTNCLFTAWRVSDMDPMSIGICRGTSVATKRHFLRSFANKRFFRKLRTYDLSFMGRCTPRVWVGRSKLIWVVNLRIVYGYVMSKWENFYRGGNGAHFHGFLGFGAVALSDLKIFSWDSGYPSVYLLADIFWPISTRSRWGTWVHTWSMYHSMYLG